MSNISISKIPLSSENESLILDALNSYFHKSKSIIEDDSSGDIERSQYIKIAVNCKNLIKEIEGV